MNAASYVGIALALLATTAYNVGLILEKRALGRMPTLEIRRVLRVVASVVMLGLLIHQVKLRSLFPAPAGA